MHIFILILHILGAGVVIGVMALSLLFSFKKQASKDMISMFITIRKVGGIAVGAQIITGIILILQEPGEFTDKPLLWVKLALIVADGIFARLLILKKLQALEASPETAPSLKGLPIWTFISTVIITGVVSCGVLIAA